MPSTQDSDSTESTVYDQPSAFDPYNPPESAEAVQPTSHGPAQSSDAPGFGGTSGEDSESGENPPQGAQEEAPPAEPPLPEFDPRHKDSFTGLLFLGRIQETFYRWGHTFVIRTLTTEDLAAIGLIVKPYEDTSVVNAVYQSAFVAAAVVSVDGKPLPSAITVDTTDELATVRFPYVMRSWMPAVREAVYNEAFALEIMSRQVLDEMGKASG